MKTQTRRDSSTKEKAKTTPGIPPTLEENRQRAHEIFRIRLGLGMLGAVLLAILLNGCASVGGAGDPDPATYNATTGYPAIGAPSLGHSL